MTSIQFPASQKVKSLNYINLKSDIDNAIPVLTALLVDDTLTPKSVRTAVFGLLRDFSKDESFKEERIMENATRCIIQTLEDRNPNRRWIAVEWLLELLELPNLHTRLQETVPQLILCLTDKDPVVRLSAVATLARFAENETFHDIIISQITPVLDLLANNNNNSDPSMRYNLAQVFIECVKYSSTLHEVVRLALPRFKELLCSSSAILRSSALKLLEDCAVFPSFHSLIIATAQGTLSEIGQLNLSLTGQTQKFLQKLVQHADLNYLRGFSVKSIEVYVGKTQSWERPVRILSMDVLEKLASVGPLEPSFSTKLPKLLSNLGGFDPEILLQLLDPDVSKFASIRKLIVANLQTLITTNFFSLAQNIMSFLLSSHEQYPNVKAIERISRYPYILDHPESVLQHSIPEFVKLALERDRHMFLVVVELLKNEKLHESFANPDTLALILQTIFDYPQSRDASKSWKQYHQFLDMSTNFARMGPITKEVHRSTFSILKCTMLSLQSQKRDSLPSRKEFYLEADLIIQSRVKASRITPERRTRGLRYFQDQFEPPVMRMLVEYMKRPVLYAALKSISITSTQLFSLPSLLLFHLDRNNLNFDWKILSVWVFTIRELFDYDMYSHLSQDLAEVVKMIKDNLFSGFTGPPESAACRVSSVMLLGEVIKDELRTRTKSFSSGHHLDFNAESYILSTLQAIESALRDGDADVRIAAVRVFEKIMPDTALEGGATRITYLITNFIGGVIPKLMEILLDKFESMDVRHLVAKSLEVYAGYNTLHIHLIHTIPALLTLLRPETTNDENARGQSQIIPIVLGVLITYGRYATLWSSIRDALADRTNISQKKYTIYEPLAVLCADEFERYPFLKQPFLDTISALSDVLNPISNPNPEEEEEDLKKDQIEEDEEDTDKGEKKPEEIEETGPTLPLQSCALRGMMELIKYPSLFLSLASTSTATSELRVPISLNNLLTRYAIILEGKVNVKDKEDDEDDDGWVNKEKRKGLKPFEDSTGNNQEARMVLTSRNESQKEMTTDDFKKPKTKSDYQLKAPHPWLRYQAICGLCDYDSPALTHLYVYILQTLPKIVDIVADGVADSDLMVRMMIGALVHVILDGDAGSSKVFVSSLFDMFLSLGSGAEFASRRIILIRIIGDLHKSVYCSNN